MNDTIELFMNNELREGAEISPPKKVSAFRQQLKSQRVVKVQEHTNGVRPKGPTVVRGGTLEESIERCVRMIAIQFLSGDEGLGDDHVVAVNCKFYRIPLNNQGDVTRLVSQIVEEDNG